MKYRNECVKCADNACHTPCISGRYIMERILYCRKTPLKYEGNLCMRRLSCQLFPPLHLQRLEVIDIEQQLVSNCCSKERKIHIRLCCQVCDCYGKQACAAASIVLSVPDALCVPPGGNLRIGAALHLLHASFSRDASVYICADIALTEVISACPVLYPGKECQSALPNKPLYPIPICMPRRDHTNIYKTLHEEYS